MAVEHSVEVCPTGMHIEITVSPETEEVFQCSSMASLTVLDRRAHCLEIERMEFGERLRNMEFELSIARQEKMLLLQAAKEVWNSNNLGQESSAASTRLQEVLSSLASLPEFHDGQSRRASRTGDPSATLQLLNRAAACLQTSNEDDRERVNHFQVLSNTGAPAERKSLTMPEESTQLMCGENNRTAYSNLSDISQAEELPSPSLPTKEDPELTEHSSSMKDVSDLKDVINCQKPVLQSTCNLQSGISDDRVKTVAEDSCADTKDQLASGTARGSLVAKTGASPPASKAVPMNTVAGDKSPRTRPRVMRSNSLPKPIVHAIEAYRKHRSSSGLGSFLPNPSESNEQPEKRNVLKPAAQSTALSRVAVKMRCLLFLKNSSGGKKMDSPMEDTDPTKPKAQGSGIGIVRKMVLQADTAAHSHDHDSNVGTAHHPEQDQRKSADKTANHMKLFTFAQKKKDIPGSAQFPKSPNPEEKQDKPVIRSRSKHSGDTWWMSRHKE